MPDQLLQAGLTVLVGIGVLVVGQIIIRFFIEPIQAQARVIGKITHGLVFYANVQGPNPSFFYEVKEPEGLDEYNRDLSIELQKERYREVMRMKAEAKRFFRECSSELLQTTNSIWTYRFLALLRIVPSPKNIICASSELIGLSNTIGNPERVDSIGKRREKLIQLLRIRILAKKYDIKL